MANPKFKPLPGKTPKQSAIAICHKQIVGSKKGGEKGKKMAIKDIKKAKWTRAYINDLPDSAFAYVEPGGKKDKEGKTVPRSKRHLPYKNHNGKIDKAHLRNALARLPQTHISAEAKAKAKRKLQAAARKVGIKTQDTKKVESRKEVKKKVAKKKEKIKKADEEVKEEEVEEETEEKRRGGI